LELESKICRVTCLWLNVIEPLGIDPASETEFPFYKRVEDGKLAFGLGIQNLQRACFDDIKRHRFVLIARRAQALPLDDPRRMAFFGRFGDKCVRQLLLGFAHPLVLLQSEELCLAVQRPFGLPLAVLKAHVGERTRNYENMPRLVVGQYGHALKSVTGATGDATRTLHGAFLAALEHSLREVGIKFKGGGRSNGSCKHFFSHLMHAFVGVDEMALHKLNGITADLLVDFTKVEASAPGGGGAGDGLFPLMRTLADTKALACGKNCRSLRAENPFKRKNYPFEQRAALVPKQYLSKARSLDHQLHGTARGTVGLIEA
jgi:hypothetical protein